MKLKENQKVYIRGGKDAIQGKRVIEELKRRGGVEKYNLEGKDNRYLYYIRPNGEIDRAYDDNDCSYGRVAEFVKEYYTEVKVNVKEWPEKGDCFYFVGPDMRWCMSVNDGCPTCKDIIRSGNCFRTYDAALEACEKMKELFKAIQQEEEKK